MILKSTDDESNQTFLWIFSYPMEITCYLGNVIGTMHGLDLWQTCNEWSRVLYLSEPETYDIHVSLRNATETHDP